MTHHRLLCHRHRQQGAATLIVVMILFFIISLVAAYTNRNLIFEQRTSANQYRSTQALEAAEAGLEWAVSMLNFGRITNACIKSTNTSDTSFRQRYLVTDPVTGKIAPALNPGGGDFTSSCVWAGAAGWDCSCPTTGAPVLTVPSGGALAPAFRVRFLLVTGGNSAATVAPQPGVVWVQVVGCTRLDVAGSLCLDFGGQGALNEGRVEVTSMVALGGNAAGLPMAALTARGAVNLAGGSMDVYNTGAGASGITVHASGAVNTATLTAHGAPGTPRAATLIQNDSTLSPVAVGTFSTTDRMFASIFNMLPQNFRDQQAAVKLTCGGSGCSAATVRTALSLNPGSPLWLTGALNVDSAGDIGSPTEPALLIVNGDVLFTTSGVNIHGIVYVSLPAGSTDWQASGTGRITGAAIVDGGVTSPGSSNTTVVYDSAILQRLRYSTGTFVRVPGSWRDFQ